MEALRPRLGPNETLTEEAILLGSRKGDPIPDAPLPAAWKGYQYSGVWFYSGIIGLPGNRR
jgi:hypothetical protein